MPRRSPIFRNRPFQPSVHFVETCACGTPVGWCRCHGPDARPPLVEIRRSSEPCENCAGPDRDLLDLDWADVSSIKVPNPAPPVRPVTLALDLIEVRHQAGEAGGVTRISPEAWESIFYRGSDAVANPSAKERAFERWKSAVRAFGFECPPHLRGEGGRGSFCVSMKKAIPWAERVLDESERKAAERKVKQVAAPVRSASSGSSRVKVRR